MSGGSAEDDGHTNVPSPGQRHLDTRQSRRRGRCTDPSAATPRRMREATSRPAGTSTSSEMSRMIRPRSSHSGTAEGGRVFYARSSISSATVPMTAARSTSMSTPISAPMRWPRPTATARRPPTPRSSTCLAHRRRFAVNGKVDVQPRRSGIQRHEGAQPAPISTSTPRPTSHRPRSSTSMATLPSTPSPEQRHRRRHCQCTGRDRRPGRRRRGSIQQHQYGTTVNVRSTATSTFRPRPSMPAAAQVQPWRLPISISTPPPARSM